MRIKSIELAWFRGAAAPVSLDLNCGSMVVYGENGSGKSSFIDAVEYVLNKGSVEHLKTEYSGSNQINAIPNTHKPDSSRTGLKVKFENDSELKVDFSPSGSSKNSITPSTQEVQMEAWEYRQTVLRQAEVSEFIHDTKGKKYSALLPLLGLHNMEIAAENLRKLAKQIETESGLSDKHSKLKQVDDKRKDVFGSQSDEQIAEAIDNLYLEYCGPKSTTNDESSLCNELKIAIDNRIMGYSADNQRHVFLKELSGLDLKSNIDAVRAASVALAGSLDPHIAERLAVLQSAGVFVDVLGDTDAVECPACGQTIAVDEFRKHIEVESDRLQEINNTYKTYRSAIGTVCDILNSLKSVLDKPDLETWKGELGGSTKLEGFKYLEDIGINALRESCSDEDLKAIESKLLPIIAAAELDSRDVPADVQKITEDKTLLGVIESVIAAKDLKTEIINYNAIVALINSLERGIRLEIRQRAQRAIDSISEDIESMWTTLHPGEKIDSVRLALPPSADKAIDVVLKFHGIEQESPRLTLSEGYRNSLGLCIFLAMAKQVADIRRPLFLDDVVVSLDRNHRGMIQELLEKEFSDRQVIVLTHDREWYTELRHQLEGNNRWSFKALLPYETPEIGIRWSHKTTTFDDARSMVAVRPDAAGNDARKIMDIELSMIAEHLQIRLPYLRSDKNDRRMAHEFLTRLVADGKKCFQKRSGNEYVRNSDAINACIKADKLLMSWGNRASHTFDVVSQEAIQLIDACEVAIACFKCDMCDPPNDVWRLDEKQSEWVQCRCGEIRWRYGKG